MHCRRRVERRKHWRSKGAVFLSVGASERRMARQEQWCHLFEPNCTLTP